ncbi:MAG TPA: YlxR family protein [Anaerolineales bacterium]|nr:YlxR family protein [Anaerolineales bacterium]
MKVPKKPVQRIKHVPQRTCVGCREVLPKRKMIRIVRTGDGVQIDPTGKLAGRGAYLHDRHECWERGLKGALGHALKTTLTQEDRARLESFMNTLPADKQAESAGLVNSQM